MTSGNCFEKYSFTQSIFASIGGLTMNPEAAVARTRRCRVSPFAVFTTSINDGSRNNSV
jgi:hypothetical protein